MGITPLLTYLLLLTSDYYRLDSSHFIIIELEKPQTALISRTDSCCFKTINDLKMNIWFYTEGRKEGGDCCHPYNNSTFNNLQTHNFSWTLQRSEIINQHEIQKKDRIQAFAYLKQIPKNIGKNNSAKIFTSYWRAIVR